MTSLTFLGVAGATGLALATAATAQPVIDASTAGLMIDGPSSSAFAESVAIVPDLDGDGVADIAVGAIAYDPLDGLGEPINNAGAVMVYSSVTGDLIRRFEGTERDGNLGFGIVILPDRDDDGVYELAIGAPRMSNGPVPEAGAVVVFSGGTGTVLDTIYGDNGERTSLGMSVAAVGDLDGDGIPELIAGASGTGATNPASPGYAVLYDGATFAELHTFTGEGPGAIFGASVAGGGDLNGDGTPDVVIGAPLQDIDDGQGGTFLDAGRVYAFSGADYSRLHAISHDGGPVETPKANFGTSVAIVGDLSGDGKADFLAGGPESQQGSGGNGFVAVYSGGNGDLIHDIEGAFATGEQHGVEVIGLDDMDGDGTPDFAAASSQICFGFCASRPGEVIIYSGDTGDPIAFFEGEDVGDNFGAAMAAGDIDGNGGTDLAITAPFHATGRAYLFLGEPVEVPCPADIDGSGDVGFDDLLAVLSAWGACG